MKLRALLWKKRLARSAWGDLALLLFLGIGAAFMALPLVFAVSHALKPLSELFLFPPRFFVRNPTLANFKDLFLLMGKSWVPISRYFFNSIIIVAGGIVGNLFVCSLAAYAIATHEFPGKKLYNRMIILSLMFAAPVTAIPSYYILAKLRMVNTYAAIILPSWAYTIGLYLMIKFMQSMISSSLIDASRIDGASEFRIYGQIVMPIIKPAWLTLTIFVFQLLWANTGGYFLYAEKLKPLPFALSQIARGGIARAGVGAAVGLVLILVPILVFVFNQSRIVETMGTSGMSTSGEE